MNASQPLDYAGDVHPTAAWHWVSAGEAVFVDVRTQVECIWVGLVPDSQHLPWLLAPETINPAFDDPIRQIAVGGVEGRKLLMLCRSGVRSIVAAQRATALGLEAWNVLEGFEGDLDECSQRGHRGGWRHHGLPWQQT
jgi:sulfur dioxygenase